MTTDHTDNNEPAPYCNPCQSYHPVSQPCFDAATTPQRITPEPLPQSQAYQDAAVVEAKLKSITSAHSRTLELMNWKLAERVGVASAAPTVDDDVLADHCRLVRELDVLLNGDKAAPQATLADIVAQLRRRREIVSFFELPTAKRVCSKCGHDGSIIGKDGRCWDAREKKDDRFQVHCGCACEFVATAAAAAPAEQSEECYWCKHPDHGNKVCPVPYLARGEGGIVGSYPCGCTLSSPAATSVEKPRTCLKCKHYDETDPRGRCISVYYDAAGSLVYCGCKCEFIAPVAATGADEGENDD